VRDSIPILADKKGVLAVLGSALGFATRARAGALAHDGDGVDRMVVRLKRLLKNELEEGREQQQR
jgi:hypothetical protein